MSDIALFLPKILQYAPGCAEPSAYDAIRSACIEFCERTRLWRDTLSINVTTSGTFTLTPPAESVIHDIESARWNGDRWIEKASIEEVDDHFPINWRDDEVTGTPEYYTQLNEDELTLVPFEAGTLSLAVRLKPTQTTESIPDFIASRYMDVIQAGALYKVLMLQTQSFYNPDLATAFGLQFNGEVSALFDKQIRGQQRARLRVKSSYR